MKLLQYIINCISDDETNKQILYNSQTINQAKKNLDHLREKSGQKKPTGKAVSKDEPSKDKKERRKEMRNNRRQRKLVALHAVH